MVFSYNTRRLFWKGFFASVWLAVGVSYMMWNPDWRRGAIYLVLGVIYMSVFAFEWRMKYVEITDAEITLQSLPRQTIAIEALIGVDIRKNQVVFRASDNVIPVKRNWIHKSQQSHFDTLTGQLQRNAPNKS